MSINMKSVTVSISDEQQKRSKNVSIYDYCNIKHLFPQKFLYYTYIYFYFYLYKHLCNISYINQNVWSSMFTLCFEQNLFLTTLEHFFFLVVKFKLSLRKFYGHHYYFVNRYRISVTMDWQRIRWDWHNHNPILSSFMTFHRVCNKSNTTGPICGAGTVFSSGAHEFIPGF